MKRHIDVVCTDDVEIFIIYCNYFLYGVFLSVGMVVKYTQGLICQQF